MMNAIWSTFARMVYNVEVEVEDQQALEQQGTSNVGSLEYSGGSVEPGYGGGEAGDEAEEASLVGAPVQQRVLDENEQLGRNDPCWCGSGKKFKKCHGA
jgi:preprotein translocase subunit SecA